MSIKTANFVVIRDNDPLRCKGDELLSTVDQRDALLVSRNDVIHKVKLPFNLDKIASVENKSVNLNYEQYAFVRNRDNGQTLAETSPPFADVQQELRVYEHLFDGDEDTTFKSYTNNGIRHELVVQFPEPIDVYGSIRIKAGFHTHARTGQLLINGNIVRELSAWDGDPQVFSADFEGQVSEFSIRQKNGASNGYAYTAVLNYIEIDGEKLKSIVPSSTELTLSSEADMSKYKVNMRVKKYQGNVTGIIGAVDEVNKKITLTGSASFSADDEIIIDQVDGNPIDFPEILDTDLFACTDVNNITYKVSGAQFKALLEPPGPLKIVVPHDTELVSENNWRIKTQATVTGGVEPYVREYSWQGFVRADSQIPVEGSGENRNTDLPLFSRSSGSECLVAFSHASQKTGAYLYNTVTGFDWNYMEKLPQINMKGGKFHAGKFWGLAAGPKGSLYLMTVNSDGTHTVERKDISEIAGDPEESRVFNLDFNTETGTVIIVGHKKIFRANYLSDPDLNNIEIISNVTFDYLRPIVCDPDTNEWWMGNNIADTFYSNDDGLTWTKLPFKYGVRNGYIESGDFYIDKDYIYVSITSQKVSGKFLRQGATSADSDNWFYCNTNDKKTIIRVGHGEKYYAKGFHDDQSEWYLTYDETVNFTDTSKPITLSAPFTNGMWATVCGEEVTIRAAVTDVVEGETFSVGANDQTPESIQCTNVVTDKVLADVQVTVSVPLTGPAVSWEECAINGWLRYTDCEAGCDSAYCSDMCKQLFTQHIQDTCGGVPPNWYSSSMTPQAVADRIFADGYNTTSTTAADPEVPEVVTVVNGVFHIDGVAQPTLSITEQTYIVFDQSDPSNNGHPLRIYEDVNRTTEVTDGVHIDGSKLTLLGLYPGTYYYQCANHAGMGGALIVTAS